MKIPCFPKSFAAVSLCLLAAGCATQQQTAAVECGAAGAGAGFLLCKALGKSDRDCMGLVAVGTTIGAGGCYAYANRLAERRQELAGRENDLNAQLRYVRGLNEDAQRLNADLRERIETATRRSRELQAQVRRSGDAGGELARERQRLDGEYKDASQQVELQRKALQEVKTYQARRSTASADLDAEIARQDRLLADAQRQVATLASLKERV